MALLALVTACTPGDEEGSNREPEISGDGAKASTIKTEIGPYELDPGSEDTRCIVFRLGNAEGAFIRRLHAELKDGSHHMTIYRSTDTQERKEPFDCVGFESVFNGDRPLFIAQQHDTDLAFPSDEEGTPIGYRLDPHQMVRLEMHYINTTAHRATFGSTIQLDVVPLSTKVVETDIAFWGTVGFQIPPNSSYETPTKFQRAIPGTHSFGLTTHQHHLATRMQVWYADNAEDTASEPIADCTDWANPPLERFDPPLAFGDGGKAGLAFKCAWNNTTPRQISFGESVNDEMCILWHYYYPSRGFMRVNQP